MAVDEPMLNGFCREEGVPGPTDALWRALGRQIEEYLGAVSVADVLSGRFDLGLQPAPNAEPLRAAG
jgi:hypothetical protein